MRHRCNFDEVHPHCEITRNCNTNESLKFIKLLSQICIFLGNLSFGIFSFATVNRMVILLTLIVMEDTNEVNVRLIIPRSIEKFLESAHLIEDHVNNL